MCACVEEPQLISEHKAQNHHAQYEICCAMRRWQTPITVRRAYHANCPPQHSSSDSWCSGATVDLVQKCDDGIRMCWWCVLTSQDCCWTWSSPRPHHPVHRNEDILAFLVFALLPLLPRTASPLTFEALSMIQ